MAGDEAKVIFHTLVLSCQAVSRLAPFILDLKSQ